MSWINRHPNLMRWHPFSTYPLSWYINPLTRRCLNLRLANIIRCSVLAAAGWPDAKTPIVLVGHQPFLGLLASSLLAGSPQMWSVKKGGVWCLTHRLRHDIPVTQLKMVMNPSMLTASDN